MLLQEKRKRDLGMQKSDKDYVQVLAQNCPSLAPPVQGFKSNITGGHEGAMDECIVHAFHSYSRMRHCQCAGREAKSTHPWRVQRIRYVKEQSGCA